jgi:uncharacterized protein
MARIADRIGTLGSDLGDAVSGALFDQTIRLGITGLSRAGKTVFITSLVANLMDRARMPGLVGADAISAAFLQPQPDDTVPRFDYENHLAALTGPTPYWPEGTKAVSELRLSFRLRPRGLLGGLRGARRLHLDIVDYPGEWLLDLTLMEKSYAEWSAETLSRLESRAKTAPPEAAAYRAAVTAADPAAPLDEPQAQALSRAFTAHLQAARAAGWSDCTPGRFLLPGELAGSPVLTFAPLPQPAPCPRGCLWREMERRYEAYKAKIVRPFFRDHFAKIDRQVVLLDVLGALHHGPAALEDMRRTMAQILTAFRPGKTAWLASLLGGKKVERILFAATKADHLHQNQHTKLTAILAALLRDARDRADFAGADTAAMSIASLRTTVEETRPTRGETLEMVRGHLPGGKQAAFYAGDLPADPARLLAPARQGAADWPQDRFQAMDFAPAPLKLRPGEGPPHIRLDRAAQFLIGDLL